MNKDEAFSIWAPADSPWSPWAKPVLFAHLDLAEDAVPDASNDLSWSLPAGGENAIVLNLPGAEGVQTALALASLGYRPVPLYNAVPIRSKGAVDVLPIVTALKAHAEALRQVDLPPNAPPVFMLDANRGAAGRGVGPGEFDNRSVSFTTDFPSANFLAAHGIKHALLVQRHQLDVQTDLAHTLRRWQEGGITLQRLRLDPLSPAERFEIPRPSWFGAMFQRVLIQLGLHRSPAGGFGNWVPESSGAGGG